MRRASSRSATCSQIHSRRFLRTSEVSFCLLNKFYQDKVDLDGTVVHGSEISYVYGNCVSRTLATQALCLNMINYWVSFATSLDPNDGKGGARPAWPQYTPQTQVQRPKMSAVSQRSHRPSFRFCLSSTVPTPR